MHQKWGFIYIATQSHTQLKVDEITEYLFACHGSEPNLKNFCGKKHAVNALNSQAMKHYTEAT